MKLAGRLCWLRGPCYCCYLLLLCAFTVAAYIGIDWYLADPMRVTSRSVDLSAEDNVDFRCEIASKLHELTIEINKIKDVNPKIFLEMNKIISQLDPRFALSNGNMLADPPPVPDTCGEVFNGTLHGHPWYRTGFVESTNCKQKVPIHELVTVLFLDQEMNTDKTADVLQTIRSYNSQIKIILGSIASTETIRIFKAKYKNVLAVSSDYEDLQRPGKILNLMVQRVKTPYVLVARDIFFFNDLARLERQVHVISSTNFVGIAGGAFRNESGYWKVGCYLSQIRNYFLKYTAGYKYSALDCMLCDYLEGPFVAKTSIMKNVPFKKNLYAEVLFEDWFLRVKQNNILSMNCPDALYFKRGPVEGVTEDIKSREHSSWLDLAREWQVDHIEYPSRISIHFTCKELKFTCDSTRWFKAFLIPSCCMEQVTGALQALDNFSKERGIDYEIDAGTVLGAVKLGNFLPWDIDGDISFLMKDYDTYYQNSDYFSEKGFSLSMFKKNKYFRLNTPEIMLEMWGISQMSTFQLPTEMWEYPTRVKMNGIWIRGVWNPGLFARNRYGSDYLKHVQHWKLLDMSDSWQVYRPGSWISCPKKAHHACLDLYPTDGSDGLLPPS